MAIFGNQDEGTLTHGIVAGGGPSHIIGSVFTISENGTADSISAFIRYFAGFGFSSATIKCAIYLHSDLSFVAETEERVFNSEVGAGTWETFSFSGSPSLTASTDYILVCWGKASATAAPSVTLFATDNSETTVSHDDLQAYNGFPDPLVPNHLNDTDSIYCTYTASATGTNLQINIGDVWKEVPAVQINIGDAWKEVAGMQINIGDAWKTIF